MADHYYIVMHTPKTPFKCRYMNDIVIIMQTPLYSHDTTVLSNRNIQPICIN